MFVLLGAVFGGLLRFAPEVLRYLNGKADRAHEIAMQKISMEQMKIAGEQKLAEIQAQAQVVLDKGGMEALKAAIKGQATVTGIAWVDAMSASVRPIVTYWWMALFTAVKTSQIVVFMSVASMGLTEAFINAWGDTEMGILSGILNFWFLDRVLSKRPIR